ncbi:hypothetical protein V5799_033507, partial [Amblyomma americanum]
MTGIEPSRSRLQWEPPAKIYGTLKEYKVKVCDTYKSCDGEHAMNGCAEYETLEAQLEFDSTAGTQYCVAITAAMECGAVNISSRPVVAPFKTPLLVLPDVASLSLVAAGSDFFTVKWERPEVPFDYYMIEAAQPNENSSERAEARRAGSCSSGTIIHPNQTQVTCSSLKPCTKWTFTVHTYSIGPPALTSLGASLYDISVLDQVPDAPSNITAVRRGASEVLLRWEAPVDPVPKSIEIYSVEVCESCFGGERGLCCWTRNTSHPSLAVSRTADETFWVHVSAGRQCAGEVAWSKATTKEFAFAPQDVTALRVTAVGDDAFTAAWNRPKERFDYYLVEVTGTRKRSNGVTQSSLASCANGTIIHPDVTQVTCGQFEAHSNVSLTVRTHRNGPPERTSPGVTLGGICIPGAAGPPDVTNLKLGTVNTNTFSVTWVRPKGCFDSYVVELYEGESASYPAQGTIGTCEGTIIVPDNNFITCRQVEKCKDLSVIVRTRSKGPPLRASPGATLQDIFNVRE